MRSYREFTYRNARYRIACTAFSAVTDEIIRQRSLLEDYIDQAPAFQASLEPVELSGNPPDIARRMADAAWKAGTGPMAAVAGAIAQVAAEAGLKAGAEEVVVENGGDIYLWVKEKIVIGLHAGGADLGGKLAFEVEPGQTPISICSSSGRMGHSDSLGDCDLATVVSRDAALADAAATRAANSVRRAEDLDAALATISRIEGVDGVLIAQGDRVGLSGDLPALVRPPG